jgi:ATP-GRASP peptide maturase of grasp-with-spasm system
MILIFSQAQLEPTTEEVMDWIERLGGRPVRLNGEDLDGGAALVLTLDGRAGGRSWLRIAPTSPAATAGATAGAAPVALPLDEVKAVWFRRWLALRRHETTGLLAAAPAEVDGAAAGDSRRSEQLEYHLRRHLTLELRKLSDALFARFGDRPWLNHPGRASPAKLDVLARASRLGLATPDTLVTTEREELRRFCARHGTVITKPVGEAEPLPDAGRRHFMYTAALDLEAVARLPERFPPSLFQERLEKTYELRVFYLDGACYAMAIFSQGDAQTRIDFRNYNHQRPNRSVPYRLQPATAEMLDRLMRELDLDCGSIDLIRTPDQREVLLEINPVGQFGMVSKPCNYHLERKVAEHLMSLAAAAPETGADGG